MKIAKLITQLRNRARSYLAGRSMLLVKGIALLSITPIALLILVWCYVWLTRDTSDWAQKMIALLMQIVDRITAPSVVAAFIAYGAKLVDANKNGIPDEYEKEEHKDEGLHQPRT